MHACGNEWYMATIAGVRTAGKRRREDGVQDRERIDQERWELIRQLDDWLERPLLVLSFVWLALLLVELIWGLNSFLEQLVIIIWVVFIIDFVVRMIVAPSRLAYLRSNWLGAISLILPALRVFRVFYFVRLLRLARIGRGLRLLRIVTSLNRTMRNLRVILGRRQFGYVFVFTGVVVATGAAGMLALENVDGRAPFDGYGDALWWTAMMLTTIGSDYWPVTAEGRILTVLLAIYSFAVFGYVTAALASFFIGQDAENEEAELAGAGAIRALHAEVRALRQALEPERAQGDQPGHM